MMRAALALSFFISSVTYANFDETLIQAPFKESNEITLYGLSCRTRNHLQWDFCFNILPDESRVARSFKFKNHGENDIVPNSGLFSGREFEFMFEDQARSDLSLLIWDAPDEFDKNGHLKMMMFFPKNVLWSIRNEYDSTKDHLIVTLPTEEEVIFNAKTREIIGGVFQEGPITTFPNGTAKIPDVTYHGRGVVIESSAIADWPVGVMGPKYATIKKKGFKNCEVLQKDLWYTDQKKGGNVFFNKKLISNESFDHYVKKKCGFSIY